MARNEIPQIAVAVRTFGNNKMHEGIRVKAGTRFAVGRPIQGLQLLTVARFNQLFGQKLIRGLNDQDVKAVPEPAPEQTATEVAKMRAGKPVDAEQIRRPSVRAAARRRLQEVDPPAPRRLNPPKSPTADVPDGSQNGSPAPASSSAADLPSNTSATTSRPRGRRRASAG